jgi:hypothetical protein
MVVADQVVQYQLTEPRGLFRQVVAVVAGLAPGHQQQLGVVADLVSLY